MRAQANIIIVLGPAASAVARTRAGGPGLVELIRSSVQDWLDLMRLPVDVNVNLTQAESVQGPAFIDVAVILNGVRCGFSKRQVRHAYESSQRVALPDHAAGTKAARELLGAAGEKDENLVHAQAFLAELVLEAVKRSSERVITTEVTEALLAQTMEESPASRPAIKGLDRSFVTDVLRRLTRVHIGVHNAAVFVQAIVRAQANGLTTGDVAERFIDFWRPRDIEIHVDPGFAKRLLNDNPVYGKSYPAADMAQDPANVLGLMYDGLFYELGIWFPSISLLFDPELPEGFCRFRLHERLTPMLRGLSHDELLVNETPERLTSIGISNARPRANPANGQACAVVSANSPPQSLAKLTTWDQFGYLVLLLSAELRAAAPMLLSIHDVEDLLGKLNTAFPELVAATLHQYSPLEVAQVLRWLLRDGVTIRDLRGVLELMLDFSYTTGIRSPTAGWSGREPYVYVGDAEFTGEPYFTEDDPFVPQFDIGSMQLFAEPAPEWIANGRIHAEFVKCGFRQYLTYKVSRGQSTIICYLLDADIEMRLQAFAVARDKPPFDEPELAQILKGMSEEFVESYGTPVLFLATTPDVAFLVQDMIAQDFPEVTVLHRQSVEETANVQPIARVPGLETVVSTT